MLCSVGFVGASLEGSVGSLEGSVGAVVGGGGVGPRDTVSTTVLPGICVQINNNTIQRKTRTD